MPWDGDGTYQTGLTLQVQTPVLATYPTTPLHPMDMAVIGRLLTLQKEAFTHHRLPCSPHRFKEQWELGLEAR
jgi:hypothetical protein